MNVKIPQISESEWEVMRVLWSKSSPATAQEVIDQLASPNNWSPRTVKTLLNRLLKKNAITFTKEGKMYYYSPVVTEEECCRMERRSFLQRIYNGSLAPMIIHFLKEEKLTKDEIEELKQILDNKAQDAP
ncbi:BlaI/MecI/CopY family transcriptional regulator [Brevibacillus humidisoli]|uniref:BlaI/MecI/CopY family transcriptional regulator n=1 Tax=Brevibacillus humidisoli TaxID=2895522 RepID=UPI001E51465D|nr:BlaI/MecI/CopY family transcriptional regulator [Brevibacillus humidisoli]UFJ39719.1 BlaI/MecI/CopY family transcriptional regulator [Brevibacillus humidisoli]